MAVDSTLSGVVSQLVEPLGWVMEYGMLWLAPSITANELVEDRAISPSGAGGTGTRA